MRESDIRYRRTEKYRKSHAAWMRAYRAKRRAYFKEYQKQYRLKCNKRHQAIIAEAKQACLRCGMTDKRVLTFHHRNPRDKTFAIANCKGRMWSIDKLLAEIAKCDVLCANCHLIVEDEIRKEKRARVHSS